MSIVQAIVSGGVSKNKCQGSVIIFPRPRNETLSKIVFGDRVEMSIRQKISNWKTFIDVYWDKNGKLDQNYFHHLQAVIQNILKINSHIDQD